MNAFSLIIFGVTGNLAKIKLLPALYDLEFNGYIPDGSRIIGTGRSEMSEDQFYNYVREVVHMDNHHHQHEVKDEVLNNLLKKMFYVQGEFHDKMLYQKLLEQGCCDKIYYMATYPELYETIFKNLEESGLNKDDAGWVRVVLEKPIGFNLETAQKLDELLLRFYKENQIFRLDHYLGKETMQNIINFRFGNGIFEPLMNNQYVEQIQVNALEDFSVGMRGGYYDSVGALRDVGQNHLLQMIALATMEPPNEFSNEAITAERIKVLQNLKPQPESLVLGQYEGYLQEKDVRNDSKTDTYFAFKTELMNDRFSGVPIYVRAGKSLERTVTEIAVVFKMPMNRIFRDIDCGMEPNILIYRIQPNEGIIMRILTKTPGHEQKIEPSYMQFCYHMLENDLIDPYERLIADVLRADQTFFNDAPEIEAQWKFIDQLRNGNDPVIYKPGTWGPDEANKLLEKDNKHWFEPSDAFCQF